MYHVTGELNVKWRKGEGRLVEGQSNMDKNKEQDIEHSPNTFLISRFAQEDFL